MIQNEASSRQPAGALAVEELAARARSWFSSGTPGALAGAASRRGGELLATGGAVRDALARAGGGDDLDLAVSLERAEWEAVATEAGIGWDPHPFRDDTVFLRRGPGDGVGSDACVTFVGRGGSAWAANAAGRDFTVNALFCGADGLPRDPLGTGLADLAARRLRLASPSAFSDDPVRIVRYARMAELVGEEVPDHDTMEAARQAAPGLASAPPVRIMRELCKLMSDVDGASVMARVGHLAASGALAAAMPSAQPGRLEGFEAAFSAGDGMGVQWEVPRHDMARLAVLGAVREQGGWRLDSPACWGDWRDEFTQACMDAMGGGPGDGGYPLRAAVVVALAEAGDWVPPRGPVGP